MVFRSLLIWIVCWLFTAARFSAGAASNDQLLEEEVGKDTSLVNLYLNLSTSYFYESAQMSEKYAVAALNVSQAIEYETGVIKAYIALGDIQQYGDPVNAHKNFLQALEKAEQSQNPYLISTALNSLAIFHIKWEQFDKAATYAQRQLDLMQTTNTVLPESIYGTLGEIYAHQKKTKEAISYYQKVYESRMATESGQKQVPGCLSDMGNVYYKAEKYDSARIYYLKGVDMAQHYDDHRSLGYLKDNVGLSFKREGNLQAALKWQLEGLKHREIVGSRLGIVTSLNNISDTYLLLGMADSALLYASTSYPLCKELNRLRYLKEVTLVLAGAHRAKGDLEKAYQFMAESLEYEQLINIKDREQALAGAAAQIEMEQQRFQNKLLQIENKHLLLTGILLAVVLCTLLVVAILVWRQSVIRKKLLQQLQEVNQTKDKLFSIIAHDVRGPINSLKSMLSLITNSQITQQEFDYFANKLHKDVVNVHFMLENLLHWSKNQLQGIFTQKESLSLRYSAASQTKALESIADEKQIRIENLIPEKIEIQADPNHIDLIYRNLIANAIKFTPEGGNITLRAQLTPDGSMAVCSVQDSGVGIVQDKLAQLFDYQQMVSTNGSNGEKGTGLGLQLIKEMVENNDGRVWAESEVGKGSTFYFMLPTSKGQMVGNAAITQ